MVDARVKELIAALDAEVPREGAQVRLHQYGGGPDESQVQANPAGYLRLGIEFLKAAYSSPGDPKTPQAVQVELGYLLRPDSTINFDWCERRDDLGPISSESYLTGFDRFVPYLIFAILAAGVLLAFIGLFTVVRWLV